MKEPGVESKSSGPKVHILNHHLSSVRDLWMWKGPRSPVNSEASSDPGLVTSIGFSLTTRGVVVMGQLF